MADYIVSADAGNGGTNLVMAKEGGGFKSHYEPSVRAVASGDTLGLGDLEVDYQYADWYGNRYVTGDDVLKVRRAVERHMGSNRYGDEFMRFMIAVSLAKMGIKEGSIDLTVFAPPGIFNEAKQSLIDGFSGECAEVKIRLKGDKKPRTFRYEKVSVMPEGIGAALCFAFDEQGNAIQSDILSGEVIVIDSGAFTLDAIQVTDGNFNLDKLAQATIPNAGVHTHIREPILKKVHEQGADFKAATIDDIDLVLRRGLTEGDYRLTIAGYTMNLDPLCKRYFERYADWISNNIADGMFNGFQGIKSVILVGGGAMMIGDKLRELYPGKILDPRKFPQTKKLHPTQMNAVGGLRFAMMQFKK